MEGQIDSQTESYIDKQTDGIDKHTDGWTDWQTDRQRMFGMYSWNQNDLCLNVETVQGRLLIVLFLCVNWQEERLTSRFETVFRYVKCLQAEVAKVSEELW